MLPPRGRPQPNRPKDGIRINQEIRVPQVRLIDAKGTQLGVVDTGKAMQIAKESELDLVEVSPNAVPPVCRIIDYGKFRFEQTKKQKAAKAHQQSTGQMKEIKLHFQTAANDYKYRMVQAQEFLEKGFKVKVLVQFKGRELSRMEFGHGLIDQAKIDLAPYGDIEELKVEKCFAISVSPRKAIKKKETPKPAMQAKHETEQNKPINSGDFKNKLAKAGLFENKPNGEFKSAPTNVGELESKPANSGEFKQAAGEALNNDGGQNA